MNIWKKKLKMKKKNKNLEIEIKNIKNIITKLNSEKNDLMNELSCLKVGVEVENDKKI